MMQNPEQYKKVIKILEERIPITKIYDVYYQSIRDLMIYQIAVDSLVELGSNLSKKDKATFFGEALAASGLDPQDYFKTDSRTMEIYKLIKSESSEEK